MLHRHTLGKIPVKPHTAHYDDDGKLLMEQCLTREGFTGPFSILYFRTPPTDEFEVEPFAVDGFCPHALVTEQPLHRRHIRPQDLDLRGDFLTARRTLLANNELHFNVCKPDQPPRRFFSNGDGDELYFIKQGAGRVECVYGVLPFREYDYVLIPKSTPYRLCFDGDRATAIVFEGRPYIQIPGDYRNRFGQLSDFAPYSHRDFRVPQELLSPAALQSAGGAARASAGGAARASAARAGAPGGPFEMVVKMRDELTLHKYEHSPLDVVGWDGAVYPIAFNIRDYQPKTGLVHLPPTIHTTFAGEGFVICSFVPRRVDWHEKAIPCPYGHANVDMDEIMYYVEGAFTSRKGIEPESISLHPLGVPHGPHPGTYEKSIGARETKEMAVMCDTHRPLRLTTVADSVEDKQYHTSWVRREGGKDWTSK